MKNRRRMRRSSLFTLIAAVALLSLGVGYAYWATTLTVDGTVNAANVKVKFTHADTSVPGTSTGHGACTFTKTDSNVSYSLSGVTPGFQCYVTWTAENLGDVPMKTVPVTTHSPSLAAWGAAIHFDIGTCAVTGGTGEPIFGFTLNQGGTATCSGTFTVLNGINPNDSLSISTAMLFEVAAP